MLIRSFDDPSTPTVLVVEDERLLRALMVDVLSETGLVSCEASNADEALSMLATYPSIAVVLTDINMPGNMDGMGLAILVNELKPAVGIVVTSGTPLAAGVPIPERGTFLFKPYRPDQLVEAVEQKLARSA
jgi:two-component system, response regulator PdtaR